MLMFNDYCFSSNSSEYRTGLFQPDVVLPEQYSGIRSQGIGGGEQRLMAAILSDGIEAYITHRSSGKQRVQEHKNDAQHWVETKDYSYVFSFDNVCSCLGIDADYLRLGLIRYVDAVKYQRKNGRAKGPTWKKIRRPRK